MIMQTVLVVDDEFGIGEVLEAILTDDGYRVVTAINGNHALERLAGNRVDLILSDLMMPVMDGAALFAALQADKRYQRIPFVLMCSLPETNIASRIKGYTAFLHKPFRVDDVLDAVRKVLGPPSSG
jgi:CheY-like chemotaxis protein